MKKIITILALMFVHNSYALEIEGINGVEVLAIDGKEASTSFFSSDKNSALKAGEHQVVVRFSKNFNNDQRVRSRPAIFNIDLQQDTQISVSGLNTQYKAERAIRDGIQWEIISSDNQYTITDSDILIDTGFLPYSNIEEVIATYNQQNGISGPATAAVATSTVATSTAAAQKTSHMPLQTLYQQASQEEKKAFRLWLLEQDMK